MAQGPSEELSLCFLLRKGQESKLAQARRVLKVAEVGKGCEIPVSLSFWGTCWQKGRADRTAANSRATEFCRIWEAKFPSFGQMAQRHLCDMRSDSARTPIPT